MQELTLLTKWLYTRVLTFSIEFSTSQRQMKKQPFIQLSSNEMKNIFSQRDPFFSLHPFRYLIQIQFHSLARTNFEEMALWGSLVFDMLLATTFILHVNICRMHLKQYCEENAQHQSLYQKRRKASCRARGTLQI